MGSPDATVAASCANVRVLRTMYRYLAHEHAPAEAARFLAALGYDEAALRDEQHWLDYERYMRAWRAIHDITGDPAIGVTLGRFTISKANLGSLWTLLRAAGYLGGGTAAGYRVVPRLANQVTRLGAFTLDALGRTTARLTWRQTPGFPFSPYHCDYRRGLLSAGPRVADLPLSEIAHPRCLGRGDAACVYDVRFTPRRDVAGRRIGLALGLAGGAAAGLAGLGWLAAAAVALAAAALGLARDSTRQLTFNTTILSDQLEELVAAKARLEQDYALLARTQATLREKERLASLGELSARVAHELRNPLGIIKASAEILGDPAKPPDVRREVTDYIVEEADRMNAAITNFLVFARPKTSHRTPTDVAAVLERLALEWQAQHDGGGPALAVTVAADLPAVLVDPHQMHQVLLNLLLNARDALGGRGTITLAAASAGDRVAIRVADDGPGFAPDVLARAFEPFVTTKPYGTGLGLTNVHQMVEANDGTVTIANGAGGGAIVTVLLETVAT